MFDLEDPASTRRKEFKSPIPVSGPPASGRKRHDLDSEPATELFNRLLDSYKRELERQEENRAEQATDEAFYDNEQWSEEDAATLADRGQLALVYNIISTTVNWVLGTEKRGRFDFHVLPRRKEESKQAEKKTQLLKYLSDVNRTPFHRSRAFADGVKVGIGWLEDALGDDDEGEPIYSRYESWRNMLWDSAATEMDLSDARYMFRSKWVDLDIVRALAPDRIAVIEQAAKDGDRFILSDDYGDDAMDHAEHELDRVGSVSRMPNRYQRERLRVIEGWFKQPVKGKRMKGGPFRGELFDPWSPGHQRALEQGYEITEKPMMRIYVAIMTVAGLLYLGPSPYRHNKYPFTPIWGNKRGRDGMPYGMIRGLKGIQEDINKRASKALHILSTSKTIVEEGASDDMDELAEEVSRPDAFLVVKAGKRFDLNVERDLSDAHLNLMERSIQMIQQHSGVTDENLGRKTNATSGIAIERRQDQGAMATTHYFDHLRLASQIQGEKQLSLVEQFMDEEKQFRITNMRGTPEFITINDGLPENDITQTKADFVISEGDFRASIRQAAAEQLMGVVKEMPPEVGLVVLDLVVENLDLPNREEIVRRLRDMTGQMDPDADEPSPEDLARMEAKAKEAQLRQEMAEAELAKLRADAGLKQMQAMKTQADAVKSNIGSMGGNRGAIDIAFDTMQAPAVAPAADAVLKEAGFVSRGEKEQVGAEAAAAQAEQPAQQPPPPETGVE